MDCRRIDDLDGNLRGVLAVRAFGQIDGAGSAMAEDRYEPIVTDDLAKERPAAIARRLIQGGAKSMRQRRSRLASVVCEQPGELFAEARVIAHLASNESVALGRRDVHGSREQLLQAPPMIAYLPCIHPAHSLPVFVSTLRC